MNRLYKYLHWFLALVGFWIAYEVEFRIASSSSSSTQAPDTSGAIDAGWLARQTHLYEFLARQGMMNACLWWAWRRYDGQQAARLIEELTKSRGFFLTRQNVSVTLKNGQVYDDPQEVPAGAQPERIKYTGKLPVRFLADKT